MSNEMKSLKIVQQDGTETSYTCKDETARTVANSAKTTADENAENIDEAKNLVFDEDDFKITETSTEVKIESNLDIPDPITIDTSMSETSGNPVANSTLYNFINSSIATNTAFYKGLYDPNEITQTFEQWLASLQNVTNNDYVFKKSVDSSGNTLYDRYKYNSSDTQWHLEYTLNNSSFTAEQWAAITSGITSALVAKIPNVGKVQTKVNDEFGYLNDKIKADSGISVEVMDDTEVEGNSYIKVGVKIDNSTIKINSQNKLEASEVVGATSSTAGTSGIIPSPRAGDNEKVLRGNATFDFAITEDEVNALDWSESPVKIGDLYYKVVKIGNMYWMAENLQLLPTGYIAHDGCDFYNSDEATYGRNGLNYGRLYNHEIALAAASQVDGWHLPTAAEWDQLANAIGGTGVAGTKLKSTTQWSSGNGTDNYGFSAFPSGYRYSGSYYNVGSNANFWTATEYSSTNAYSRNFLTGASMNSNHISKSSYYYSVRLVKDS